MATYVRVTDIATVVTADVPAYPGGDGFSVHTRHVELSDSVGASGCQTRSIPDSQLTVLPRP